MPRLDRLQQRGFNDFNPMDSFVVKLPHKVAVFCHADPVGAHTVCDMGMTHSQVLFHSASDLHYVQDRNRLGPGSCCWCSLGHSFIQHDDRYYTRRQAGG